MKALKILCFILCSSVLLYGCNASKEAEKTSDSEEIEKLKLQQVDALELEDANTTFSKMKASYEKKSLLVELKYGGGCKTHEFKAFTTGINENVLTITVADFTLDDRCRALVSKSILIDLGKFRPGKNFNRILLNGEIEITVN